MHFSTLLSILQASLLFATTTLLDNNSAVSAFSPSSSSSSLLQIQKQPVAAINPSIKSLHHQQQQHQQQLHRQLTTLLQSTPDDDGGPSDYDPQDILPEDKQVTVDLNEDDAIIRDELKRELLLIGSITNRGQYASNEEKNIIIDLVTQLEALNPTPDPSSQCEGDWDLCLTSTQAFRSSPFFQSIRAIFGDGGTSTNSDGSFGGSFGDASTAENAFNLHDKATSVGKVGRVRQSILSDGSFVSEVDIEVGLMGGMPFAIKGTVVTSAMYAITSPEGWDLTVKTTQVKRSNVPFLDQILDDYPLEVPVGSVYESLRGNVPVAKLKTFYVDEAMRITRDQDDNFYVFCRA